MRNVWKSKGQGPGSRLLKKLDVGRETDRKGEREREYTGIKPLFFVLQLMPLINYLQHHNQVVLQVLPEVASDHLSRNSP